MFYTLLGGLVVLRVLCGGDGPILLSLRDCGPHQLQEGVVHRQVPHILGDEVLVKRTLLLRQPEQAGATDGVTTGQADRQVVLFIENVVTDLFKIQD